MNYRDMKKGADIIINTCARVKKEETVLIITENGLLSIANCIADSVRDTEAEPVISIIEKRQVDGQEPPELVAESMKRSDVFLCLVSKSITHTNAAKNAIMNGSRGLMLTQFDETMMVSSSLQADFNHVKPICKKIASILEDSEKVHLTTTHGTNLTFSAKGRKGNALVAIVEKGEFSPIPNVEANVSPLEGSANGIIVADASIPYIGIGILKKPVTLHVKDNFIRKIEGDEEAKILKDDLESKNDPNVYNIAELGIGLNPNSRFSGFMLEDEGVYGSVHIGIGTSINLGGTIKAKCHYDLIMTGVTLICDDIVVIKDGEVQIGINK